MNGTFLGSRKIGVRYSEKKDLTPPARPKKKADRSEKPVHNLDPSTGGGDTQKSTKDGRKVILPGHYKHAHNT